MRTDALIINPGDRFVRLTIIEETEKYRKMRRFLCVCECGEVRAFRLSDLRSGHIKSCGCLRDEQNSTASQTHGLSKTPLYRAWHGMKQRCLNKKCRAYKWYGLRGITICPEWMEFEPFAAWAMSNGYAEGLTLERNRVNGNYEPCNCRWATMPEQSRNKRNNVFLTLEGTTMCHKDWANMIGISNTALQKRLRNWPLRRALTEPPNQKFIR